MTLSTIERVLVLRKTAIFGAIAAEHLVPLARVSEEASFLPGEAIIEQGDVADCLYVLVDGTVSVQIAEIGEVSTASGHSVIGEMALISRLRAGTCIAVSEVTALRIDYDAFWELLADYPPIALGLIATLIQRIEETTQRLHERADEGSTAAGVAGRSIDASALSS